MQTTYVYTLSKPDGTIFYVGKGKGNRAYTHLKRKDRHPVTHTIQKMLSNNITPVIQMYPCSSEEAALTIELYAINTIGRKDLGKGALLNLTDGGENPPKATGRVITQEMKEHLRKNLLGKKRPDVGAKISAAKKGKKIGARPKEVYERIVASRRKGKGYIHTEETIAKISNSKKGTTPWNIGKTTPDEIKEKQRQSALRRWSKGL